jgi:hypothetical protein
VRLRWHLHVVPAEAGTHAERPEPQLFFLLPELRGTKLGMGSRLRGNDVLELAK